MDLRRYRILP